MLFLRKQNGSSPFMSEEQSCYSVSRRQVGLHLCQDLLTFFIKTNKQAKNIPIKSFLGTKNEKTPNAAFKINASACKNSQGFPEWPPTQAATSACHAVTTGESNAWAQGETECSS